MSSLTTFRGDLEWVHGREGHAGKPYWPGGNSGVTLDPGVDLGYAPLSLILNAYTLLLDEHQLISVQSVHKLRGRQALTALAEDATLRSIRIGLLDARALFPIVVEPYWAQISRRFPRLAHVKTPMAVQTALLSLAYNRGAYNKGLEVLAQPIQAEDWAAVAEEISEMQQNHQLAGIRVRRQAEAQLIRDEIRKRS